MARSLGIIEAHGEALALLIEERITLEAAPSALPRILLGQSLKVIVDF
jgi:hypothetical protein